MNGMIKVPSGLKKIDAMHVAFGVSDPERKCSECKYFMEKIWDKKYFKCRIYGDTNSDATDWRKKYSACGLIDGEYTGAPILEYTKRRKPTKGEERPVDGQMEFLDILPLDYAAGLERSHRAMLSLFNLVPAIRTKWFGTSDIQWILEQCTMEDIFKILEEAYK